MEYKFWAVFMKNFYFYLQKTCHRRSFCAFLKKQTKKGNLGQNIYRHYPQEVNVGLTLQVVE